MAEIIGVTALNRYVKAILDENTNLRDIAVEGELSNFVKYPSTGHCYFSLKDEKSVVKAMMYSNYARDLSFEPRDGMKVVVRGYVSLYERDGKYQLYVTNMFPSGFGAYRIAFEKTKKKLEAEGLFDVSRKKPLPAFPFKIGVVTSESGAAIHDIISVARRRFPACHLVISPCRVQGEGAEDTIVQAIQKLKNTDVEAIIISRGGGGSENLWVFNSEKIARAAYECKVPTVSAVGHEIDYFILDFVCDARAATPTAAAEILMPDIDDVRMFLFSQKKAFDDKVRLIVNGGTDRLDRIYRSDGFLSFRNGIESKEQRISYIKRLMKERIRTGFGGFYRALSKTADLLESQSPLNILKKGYSLIYKDGNIAKDITFTPGETAQILTFSQNLTCRITGAKPRKDM